MCRCPGLQKCSPRIRQFDNFERLECWGGKGRGKSDGVEDGGKEDGCIVVGLREVSFVDGG